MLDTNNTVINKDNNIKEHLFKKSYQMILE